LGTVTIGNRKLFIKFAKRTVARKEVLAVLRALTYSNKSTDPDVLKKVVRVSLKDNGQVATQAILDLQIQSIDDVTQIRLEQPRMKYRPNSLCLSVLGCWPVAGLRKACLEDPDTEFLDGGGLSVDIVGGQKGDTLSLMTPQQQSACREAAESYAETQKALHSGTQMGHIWSVEVWQGTIRQTGKKLSTMDGLEIGTVDVVTKSGITTSMRINFIAHSPPAVSLQLASYVLNCICFKNTQEKPLLIGQRTLQIKVRDAANPIDGKAKIFVDVCKPLVTLSQAPSFKRKVTSKETFIFERPVAFVGEKPSAVLQHGFTQVSIIEGAADGDKLSIAAKDGISPGEMNVHHGVDFLGKITIQEPHRLRLEHGWASRITTKSLAAFVGALQFKTSQPSPGRRVFELLCHDGNSDPSCVRVTLELK